MKSNSGASRYLIKKNKGWYRALHSCTILFLLGDDFMKIEVLSHASIKIIGEKIIYIDPYDIHEKLEDADYIFITHDHYDHFDSESINSIKNDTTKLIVPKCLEGNGDLVVEPDKEYIIDNIKFQTISSYNTDKSFHPKSKEYVGYNILLEDEYYYIMGDTDRTPEADLVKTDICFVPIGGTYTMDVNEAADYINFIKPKVAVPIHYGKIVGDISLGREFKDKVSSDIEVKILITEER